MKSSFLRPRAGDRLVMDVAHRLTERDRSIVTMLYRHRVFTTDQLAEMYFDNLNTAQHRLTTLYKLRLVDRFQPLDHRCASLPNHYVLDELGAMVMAAERGEDPDKSHWRADKALAIGRSQRLRHLVGVNGFFSALMAESRRRQDCDLSLWWSERHCASQFDRSANPDGLGRWEEAGYQVIFCLEYDRTASASRSAGSKSECLTNRSATRWRSSSCSAIRSTPGWCSGRRCNGTRSSLTSTLRPRS